MLRGQSHNTLDFIFRISKIGSLALPCLLSSVVGATHGFVAWCTLDGALRCCCAPATPSAVCGPPSGISILDTELCRLEFLFCSLGHRASLLTASICSLIVTIWFSEFFEKPLCVEPVWRSCFSHLRASLLGSSPFRHAHGFWAFTVGLSC